MWDFPRVQIAIAAGALMVLLAFMTGAPKWALIAVAAGCFAYQCWRILPYTPLTRKEMRLAPQAPCEQVRLLSANVLQENRRYGLLLQFIEETDPDVLLLMEIDAP